MRPLLRSSIVAVVFSVTEAFSFSSVAPSIKASFKGVSQQCVYAAVRGLIKPAEIRIRIFEAEDKSPRRSYLFFKDETLKGEVPEYLGTTISMDSAKGSPVTMSVEFERGSDLDQSQLRARVGDRVQALEREFYKICPQRLKR